MSVNDGKCDGCGNGPFPSTMPGLFFEITGFEEQRVAGGANKISLRGRTGKLMCASCVRKLKSGISLDQERMKF